MTDILDQIVSRRRADIASLGYTMGASVPKERTRAAPVPFPAPLTAEKGVVLEIKRASPSKGDIAPDLDAAQTATQYAAAGTTAISVLTEQHWFKGGLDDLQAACAAVDNYAAEHGTPRIAILRKDFLLAPEEVEIAYRCGADAVLLIARILSAQEMTAMAQTCQKLGMTAFIELRQQEDLQKLAVVAESTDTNHIVCGVNARDLKDFSIDLLTPAGLLSEIRRIVSAHTKNNSSTVRCIFESGIRTPEAARFAGSLGFTGMLLGEAAARNPAEAKSLVSAFITAPTTPNAQQWLKFAAAVHAKNTTQSDARPFVKICGLTNLIDAQKAFELGADFLGFIFWEKSPRRTDEQTVRTISEKIRAQAKTQGKPAPALVGVIVDADTTDGKTVRNLVREGILDFVQLHGCAEEFFALDAQQESVFSENSKQNTLRATSETDLPHYAVVNISSEEDIAKIDALRLRGEPRMLIDASSALTPGGTGKRIADALVEKVAHKTKLWLAGGITPENVRSVCKTFCPELIDVASGVESAPGKKDFSKLERFFSELQ
ncbi:MAG: bifunctional indole-3-glycerol phosphate synthase/phosphoribosylanthranilate isomerase [Treponema sp.]|nr:bifunctional indole-3-glycerol phosphate synthase/phosphoribosylanthranilate isomerase [Treponema sp.]